MDSQNSSVQKKNQTLWLVIVIGMLLIAFSGWYSISKSTPNRRNSNQIAVTNHNSNKESANVNINVGDWKSCVSNDPTFSYKYPENWTVQDVITTNTSVLGSECHSFGDPYTSFQVTYSDPNDCSTLSDCVQKHPYQFSGQYSSAGDLEATTVGGDKALTIYRQRTDSGMWRYRVYYVLHGSKMYTLYSVSYPGADDANDQMIKTIVGTFQFATDSANPNVNFPEKDFHGSVSPYSSDLQDYTNSQLGIGLRFPNSFLIAEDIGRVSGADIPFFSISINLKLHPVVGQEMIISNRPTGFESDNILDQGITSIDGKQVRWELVSNTINSSAQKIKRYFFSPLNSTNQYAEYWIAFPVQGDGKNSTFDAVIQSFKLLK